MRPYLLKLMHRNSVPNMDLEQFAINLGEWELIPVLVKDVVVGAIAEKDGEIHLAFEKQYSNKSVFCKSNLNQIIKSMIDLYGYVTTTVDSDDEDTRKFVRRIGFKDYSNLGNVTTYAMSKIQEGRNKCQQQ